MMHLPSLFPRPAVLVHHSSPTQSVTQSLDSNAMASILRNHGVGRSPLARPCSATGGRLCLKVTDQSYKTNLQGASIRVMDQVRGVRVGRVRV